MGVNEGGEVVLVVLVVMWVIGVLVVMGVMGVLVVMVVLGVMGVMWVLVVMGVMGVLVMVVVMGVYGDSQPHSLASDSLRGEMRLADGEYHPC